MTTIQLVLSTAFLVVTVALVAMILVQKPKGGGVSALFGGGIADTAQSSSLAGRNLFRTTAVLAALWAATLIASAVVASS